MGVSWFFSERAVESMYRVRVRVPFAQVLRHEPHPICKISFSYDTAYGGGKFAISYLLSQTLESMKDQCIQRYPRLYDSDDRMQSCMSQLVPLTNDLGFHQYF